MRRGSWSWPSGRHNLPLFLGIWTWRPRSQETQQQRTSKGSGHRKQTENSQQLFEGQSVCALRNWNNRIKIISDIAENKMLFNASRYQHIQLDIKVNGQWLPTKVRHGRTKFSSRRASILLNSYQKRLFLFIACNFTWQYLKHVNFKLHSQQFSCRADLSSSFPISPVSRKEIFKWTKKKLPNRGGKPVQLSRGTSL